MMQRHCTRRGDNFEPSGDTSGLYRADSIHCEGVSINREVVAAVSVASSDVMEASMDGLEIPLDIALTPSGNIEFTQFVKQCL